MNEKFGYYLGIVSGIALVYGLYLLGVYGIISSIVNREIPYAPITMMLVVFAIRKIMGIQIYLFLRAQAEATANRIGNLDPNVQRMIAKITGNGGVN